MNTHEPVVRQMRQQALEIFQAGLTAVDPIEAINRHVRLTDDTLRIDDRRIDLKNIERVLIVGAGKAVAPMAKALEDLLGERIAEGVIVVKEGHGLPLQHVKICEGGHPVPDEGGVRGTEEVLSLATEASANDLVICLISGGGSALLIAPPEGVSLKDKQEATKLLLACGANIHELNTVRKHLSRSKGGRLARASYPAAVISLILSDVVGDDLDVIGSGPTVPDSSTFQETQQILKGYQVWDDLAESIRNHIERGISRKIEDTPKSDDTAFQRCSAVLVGTNLQAMLAAGKEADRLGYQPVILSTKLEGEAREVAKVQAAIAKEVASSGNPISPPACLLFGGETTVTLQGDGKGGRNQEYALASALALEAHDGIVVLSGGTDGTDGPTDAAGAIADGATITRDRQKGLDPKDFLRRNDSYNFFKQLDDLIITGPTRTNVMDIYMFLIKGEQGD
jgi:hydroxypyruvate reductase